MTTAQTALRFFVAKGWTPAQAAGIVANLQAESGLRPDAVGDGGQAYGVAQWHPDRQQHFANIIGKDIRGSTLDEQLSFVHAELNMWEKVAGDALRSCETAEQAGMCVSKLYERPADREGEATKRAALAAKLFATLDDEQPAAPIEDHSEPIPQTEGNKMGAISILLPLISQLLPMVGTLFGGHKDAQNAQAIGTVLDTIVKATGQSGPVDVGTVGTAIQMMLADKTVTAKVAQAIVTNPEVLPLLQIGEVSGGAAAARKSDLESRALPEAPFYKTSAVFWISLILIPLVAWYVGSSIVGGVEIPKEWPWYAQLPLKIFGVAWDAGARVGLANLVVGLVLGGICGVYYGVSVTQAKQAAQAAQDKPKEM